MAQTDLVIAGIEPVLEAWQWGEVTDETSDEVVYWEDAYTDETLDESWSDDVDWGDEEYYDDYYVDEEEDWDWIDEDYYEEDWQWSEEDWQWSEDDWQYVDEDNYVWWEDTIDFSDVWDDVIVDPWSYQDKIDILYCAGFGDGIYAGDILYCQQLGDISSSDLRGAERATAVIPEPNVLLLTIAGVLMLTMRGRR
ncbi:MAG: hypothetical protein IT445_03215 [Phycisphaeraceae bacterium]|nr:hypothetical protein [Phycisphaeraceae bacterium]